jgi:hypothetical protein
LIFMVNEFKAVFGGHGIYPSLNDYSTLYQ